MKTIKKKEGEAFEALKKEFCYANIMQAPRVKSVSVSVGTGSFKDKKKIDIVINEFFLQSTIESFTMSVHLRSSRVGMKMNDGFFACFSSEALFKLATIIRENIFNIVREKH